MAEGVDTRTTFNIVDPAGSLAINGIMSDLGTAGCPVVKTGSGTLTLSVANTYVGHPHRSTPARSS